MDDLELLKKYEPVLRFSKGERFFPMEVEPYLEKCLLFPSGPIGAAELLGYIHEPLLERMGRLNSHEFFLRFVNKPLNDFDAWIWWGGLSLVGLGVGWFSLSLAGVEIVIGASLAAALVLFMLVSPIRLRIIPAVLAVTVFLILGIAPVWLFFKPIPGISIAVEYLILLPIYLLLLFYLLIRVLKFIIEHILPEGPGLVMDMLSQSTEKIAMEAYHQYAEILKDHHQPAYYGRVLHEADKAGHQWTILQYHFFYAFNDWRLAANGFNHHEGDWEMVAVYLKDEMPYATLLSQHGAGNMERWESVIKVHEVDGKETTHPIIYTALGSHANYSKPDVIRSPAMYNPGRLQRFLFWFDGLVHYFFLLFNPSQKARHLALEEMRMIQEHIFEEHIFEDIRDETDHYIVRLPMEIATGDGLRLGFQGRNSKEPVIRSSDYLKQKMNDRKTTLLPNREWKRILLNSEPAWVQYKGLWGVKSFLNQESGPPGPKWDRLQKSQTGVRERVRWEKPLDWLAMLERQKH
ncbi:MAG TPA: hypothetical protein PK078_00655 [Anaerolineales bacterium]|nr:hypothetical protein [Anaerolineales bacterium]